MSTRAAWYARVGDRTLGPYGSDELNELTSRGVIPLKAQVWDAAGQQSRPSPGSHPNLEWIANHVGAGFFRALGAAPILAVTLAIVLVVLYFSLEQVWVERLASFSQWLRSPPVPQAPLASTKDSRQGLKADYLESLGDYGDVVEVSNHSMGEAMGIVVAIKVVPVQSALDLKERTVARLRFDYVAAGESRRQSVERPKFDRRREVLKCFVDSATRSPGENF